MLAGEWYRGSGGELDAMVARTAAPLAVINDPVQRREGWDRAEPIRIGDNVWLGGGAIVGSPARPTG